MGKGRIRPGACLAALLASLLTGCQTIGYYAQAIHGQSQVLHRRQSISSLLANPATPEPLKQKLHLVLELRTFAEERLHLPANGHYLTYADLKRPYAIWNVYAAPEFSLVAKSWWYPVVGSLTYRGYFSERQARRLAARLEKQGYDVHVGGVAAYSTLGWFRDPVLNTFATYAEIDLAELLFHELTHQRLFIAGDTDFNEALATAVAEEGLRRWFECKNNADLLRRSREELQRHQQFIELVTEARAQLQALYAALELIPHGTTELHQARARKQAVLTRVRQNYDALKQSWGGRTDYDAWFRGDLNNAQFNTIDTYYRWVSAFHRLLQNQGGDLEAFFKEVRALARLRKEPRHARLEDLVAGETQPSAPVLQR